jgi:hypothetical protein
MASVTRLHDETLIMDVYRPDGHGKISFDWGSYEGFFIKGKAHGWGIQAMRRRALPGAHRLEEVIALYRGDWKEGRREGYGRLEIPWESKIYEGGWMKGKAYGFGKITTMKRGWAAEWEETGFKEGVRHGWGVTCITSESKETTWYTGGFKNGDRHGYYLSCVGTTETYTSLRHGVLHGYQTVIKDGVVKSREFFLEGMRSTQPTNPFPSTSFPSSVSFLAVGALFSGPTHTIYGSVTLSDRDTYTGNLHYGTAHGYGIMYFSTSHGHPGTYEGGWKHGVACGYGVWTGADGFVYEGGWLDGRPFGYGKVISGGYAFDTFWEVGSGWRFETTWNLVPPVQVVRIPSPQPLPRNWEL